MLICGLLYLLLLPMLSGIGMLGLGPALMAGRAGAAHVVLLLSGLLLPLRGLMYLLLARRRGNRPGRMSVLLAAVELLLGAGLLLLPQLVILRIIGRLSMPLYAYMIAQGCRYTHDRRRYFLRLAGLALACQVVYYLADRSLYQCILVTFSLSVLCISAIDRARRRNGLGWTLAAAAVLLGAGAICELLPCWIPGFAVDYGFFGVFLTILLYYAGKKGIVPGMLLLCLSLGCNGGPWQRCR